MSFQGSKFNRVGFQSLAVSTLTVSALLVSCGTGSQENRSTFNAVTPPLNTSREISCPLEDEGTNTRTFRGKTVVYSDSDSIDYASDGWWKDSQPWFSADALDSKILKHPGFPGNSPAFKSSEPVNARVVVVDIRKVNGKLVYHYFSNETGNSPLENWSSTKSLVMLQAAHTLRYKHGIPFLSQVSGSPSAASKWIADHVNDVALTSNNRTAAWFKSITGAQGSHQFVRNWLVGTSDSNTSFGGLHGEAPAAHGNWFFPAGKGPAKQIAQVGNIKGVSDNTLMPVLMAEFWKRLAVNKQDPVTWLKNADYAGPIQSAVERKKKFFDPTLPSSLSDEDLKVLLYGYVNSSQNGGLQLGATQHGEFVDAFGGKTKLDQLTGGKWRMFGKTGSGFSNSRKRFEAAFGGSLCIPADKTRATLKSGRQIAFFVNIQAQGSAGAPRLDVLKGISSSFLPELTGAANLWK